MKLRLAFASALALSAAACASGPALEALNAMRVLENNPSEGISYTNLSGSGGDLTLKNVTLRTSVPDGGMVELGAAPPPGAPPPQMKLEAVAKADTLRFTGLDMKNGKPVFTGMVFSGITPVDDMSGVAMKIGAIGIEGMNAATGAYLADAFTKDGPGEAPSFEQWAFGKASLNGFSIASPLPAEEEGGQAGAINMQLGEISLSNVKDKVIGQARFAGLKGDISISGDFPIAGTYDFGTLDYGNIRAGLFADAFSASMASLATDAPPTDWSKVFEGFTSPLEYGLDTATWTGMKADFSGLKFDVSPASYKATRNAAGVVVATTRPRATFRLTADAGSGALGAMGLLVMTMAGYPSNVIEAYAQGDASFDPQKDLTRYTNFNVGISDVVDVKLDGGLIGLQRALPTVLAGLMSVVGATETIAAEAVKEGEEQADGGDDDADPDPGADADANDDGPMSGIPAEAQGAVMQMVMGLIGLQVTDLDISITDKHLVGFILNQTASQSGQSAAASRQDLANLVQGSAVFLSDAGVDPVLASEATEAIAGFLGGPGTLRIQMKPKTPVGMMSAMMTPLTKENLGFSATFAPAVQAAPN